MQTSYPASKSDRRMITVLHCDMVESTKLTESLDIEEIDDIKRRFEGICQSVIGSHSGVFGRYTGDGIEGYFGYPIANEDAVGMD